MITSIETTLSINEVGGKVSAISILKEKGYPVPKGFVLSKKVWDEILEYNKANKKLKDLLLQELSIKDISENINDLISKFKLPLNIIADLEKNLDSGNFYAIRSSGLLEDSAEYSFAGQYDSFLNVSGIKELSNKIIKCFNSLYSETVLTYAKEHSIAFESLKMAVLIQEMIQADVSGVVFTINPATGADTELLVEAVSGLGENLVSGHVTPERYVYDWYSSKYKTQPKEPLLSKKEIEKLIQIAIKLQVDLGYPVDIEFSFIKGELFILQCRPITSVSFQGLSDTWTTANFKDGGVSATVCVQFMWSLYEYTWNSSMYDYAVDGKIYSKENMAGRDESIYFAARPYWNLSIAKGAMERVPGYIERNYDNEFGISPNYEGNGVETKLSIKNIARLVPMVVAQVSLLNRRKKEFVPYLAKFHKDYAKYRKLYEKEMPLTEITEIIRTLIIKDYHQVETFYFSQAFINTVHQAMFKDAVLKVTNPNGYFNLIGGLDDISHLRPFFHQWGISRSIKNNPDSYKFWQNHTKVIFDKYNEGSTEHYLKEFSNHVKKFGYHSKRELDIVEPLFEEDIYGLIESFKQVIEIDHDQSPYKTLEKQKINYQKELDKLKEKLSKRAFKSYLKKINNMRNLLWWREEYRDCSTRFYALIHLFVQKLAHIYVEKGIISDIKQIWFITYTDLFKFIDKEIDEKQLNEIINKNKKYYNSFRNYDNPFEVSSGKKVTASSIPQNAEMLKGISCSQGVVRGKAKVINGMNDIHKIELNDILITKFTDTGWTSKFPLIKGLVTEHGGILCHGAIVSREYGIPCVMGVKHATDIIETGDMVTINSETGEVFIFKDEK